jgi:prepilin-type N-terminal cleavage/methylation domain-containing protein
VRGLQESGLRPRDRPGGLTTLRWPRACCQLTETLPSGFSLIELLVAMTLLAVGLLGTARLTTVAITGNLSSQRFSTASVLGQELMEDARRSGATGLPEARTEDYRTLPGHPEFKRVVGIAENQPAPGLKTFSVTVYWDADVRSLRLQTILAP